MLSFKFWSRGISILGLVLLSLLVLSLPCASRSFFITMPFARGEPNFPTSPYPFEDHYTVAGAPAISVASITDASSMTPAFTEKDVIAYASAHHPPLLGWWAHVTVPVI